VNAFLPNAAFHVPRGWVMAMDWIDLLFMHWPVPAGSLRRFIPAGLELDLHQGTAWIGVVPFRMSGVRPRFLPDLPGLSAFPELNVRTYVTKGGIPGVWFFSLDAANPLAVRGARRFFHLPYFDAKMNLIHADREYAYYSRRTHHGAAPAEFEAVYAPTGASYRAIAGSLDDWLTARYCFYSADDEGSIFRCNVHHKPWRLQPARASILRNTMTDPIGLKLPDIPPLLHFAERTEVVGWFPERLV
jgi:uncharacterized protein YqjF (DUF2071 family)